MASINGVTLKSIKTFEGMEGTGVQASVYLNGTKLGTWLDVANGGMHQFDFDTSVLEPAILRMQSTVKGEMQSHYDIECFFGDVLNLCLLEKKYVKNKKKGFNCLLVGFVCASFDCSLSLRSADEIKAEDNFNIINHLLKSGADMEEIELIVVKSLGDLVWDRG